MLVTLSLVRNSIVIIINGQERESMYYDDWYDDFDGFDDGMWDPFFGGPHHGFGHNRFPHHRRHPHFGRRRRFCRGFGCRRRRWW